MKNWIYALTITFLAATTANADGLLTNYSGKFLVELSGAFSNSTLEFLVNGNGETKVTKYTGDEALGIPTVSVNVVTVTETYGPDALPLAIFTFAEGSDEETHAYPFVLTLERDGKDTTPVLLGAYYTINDGPNEVTHASKHALTLSKWNKVSKQFEKIESLR